MRFGRQRQLCRTQCRPAPSCWPAHKGTQAQARGAVPMAPWWPGPARPLQLQSEAKCARRAALSLPLRRLSPASDDAELLCPVWTPVSGCAVANLHVRPARFSFTVGPGTRLSPLFRVYAVFPSVSEQSPPRHAVEAFRGGAQRSRWPAVRTATGRVFTGFHAGGSQEWDPNPSAEPSHLVLSFPCICEKRSRVENLVMTKTFVFLFD